MDLVTPAPLTGPLAPRLRPDSHLVAAARDLVARHQASVVDGRCQRCEEAYPCAMADHAAHVCLAAGVDPAGSDLGPPAGRELAA